MKVTGAETKVQKPKTKKGKRALQQREPKLVSCCFSGSLTTGPIMTSTNKNLCRNGLKWTPMQVEDPKRALILFGGKTSQITKDVLSDLHKLKSSVSCFCVLRSAWYTRFPWQASIDLDHCPSGRLSEIH